MHARLARLTRRSLTRRLGRGWTLQLALPIAALLVPVPARPAPQSPLPRRAAPSLTPSTTGDLLVGVLSEQWARRCTAKGDEWVDPHLEVGFVRLQPARGAKLEKARGLPVIARGRALSSVKSAPAADTAPCEQAQMRSDWVHARSGFRIRRPGTRPAGFAADRVERWDGLVLSRAGERISVKLKNTLGRPLGDVVLTLHYEGCYGKPNSLTEHRRFATLAAGDSVESDFPVLKRLPAGTASPRGGVHAAHSVQLDARAERITFDLDLGLPPELAVTCPGR